MDFVRFAVLRNVSYTSSVVVDDEIDISRSIIVCLGGLVLGALDR